jgi:insulysin
VKGSGVPGHPFANNGCGTIDTLLHTPIAEGRDPRAELISWYETHYSADRMHISVTGTQSVDELEQAVRQRLDGVPRRNTVIDFPKGPWFSDEALKVR